MIKEKDILIPVDKNDPEQFTPEYEEINLEEWAAKVFNDIDAENSDEELNRYKKWIKNRAFYRGQQRGFWDSKKRTWVTTDLDSLSPSDASLLVVNNQFRPQVKTLSKEFSRSQTRVRASAISDSQRSVLTGRFVDALIRYYQPKLMPESLRQVEAKHLLLCGNAFRYTIFDKNQKSANVKITKTGTKNLPDYSASVCTDCGMKEEGEMEVCPSCKGQMEVTKVEGKEVHGVPVGMDTINAGDPKTEIVDPAEIKMWASASCLEGSPYLRRRRFVKGEYILEAFPFYTPKENAKLTDTAQAQRQFSDTVSPKDSANSIRGLYEYTQLWLEPSYYARKKTEKDVTFKKKTDKGYVNHTLPKGTILDKEFPDGMYICRVGKDILGYYGETKNKVWLHIPYDINIDGVWADGLEDSVMNQQIINEYTSLSVENVLYNASPKLVINPTLINPVTVTGRPKDMILMSDNARRDTNPELAFRQISGMSLTSEVATGIETAKRDMREQTGALLGFNGQGDPNITTATGMSIARDSALALVSTPLAIRAEADEKWCWQIIQIVKEHWYDQKYKFLLGKYNESEAEAFRESDLKEEIQLFIEPNSWMPQTNYEKLQNLGAYLTAFGLPLGFLNPQVPETVRNYASQLYNIPFDFDELAPDIRIAQKRLNKMKEIAETEIPKAIEAATVIAHIKAQHAAAGDTEGEAAFHEKGTLVLSGTAKILSDAMGVEEDIDDHPVFINEYTKYLKTDEGQNIHPIERQAIKATIADHKAFWKTQQADAAANSAALSMGMPPKSGGGSPPPVFQAPAESPFASKNPNEGVQDFSSNADNSEL